MHSDRVAALYAEKGEVLTYVKFTTVRDFVTGIDTKTGNSYSITAPVIDYRPNQITNLIQQGDRRVLLPYNVPFTPQEGDMVTASGQEYTVMAVNPKKHGNVIIQWELRVRG